MTLTPNQLQSLDHIRAARELLDRATKLILDEKPIPDQLLDRAMAEVDRARIADA